MLYKNTSYNIFIEKFIWNFNAHFLLFFNNLYNPCFLKYLGLIVSLLYSEYDKHYLRNN